MASIKRILSFAMAMVLVFSMLPMSALAVETEPAEDIGNSEIVEVEPTEEPLEEPTEEITAEPEEDPADDADAGIASVDGGVITEKILSEQVTITYTDSAVDSKVYVTAYNQTSNLWSYAYNNKAGEGTATDTITITNNTSNSRVTFTFAATKMTVSTTIDDVAVDGSSITLNPGKSAVLTVNVAAGVYGYVDVSAFAAEEISAAKVTFQFDSNLGTVKMNGVAVQPGTPYPVDENGVTLTAAVTKTGATFLSWIDAADDTVLTESNTYNYTPTGNIVINVAFAHADAPAWFKVDGTYYTDDLNKATQLGSTIILAADGTLPAGDYTIPSGDGLLIPYNTRTSLHDNPILDNGNGSIYTLKSVQDSKPYRTLSVKNGANLTVKGVLQVDSTVFASGARDTTTPHGPYGLMVLEGGSKVTVASGGEVRAFGFIIGTYQNGVYTGGKIVVEAYGTLRELFQLRDLRGQNATEICGNNGIFPVTQYYVQNVEALLEVYPDATTSAYMVAYNGWLKPETEPVMMGRNTGLFQIQSGKLTRLYNPLTEKIEYTAYGDMNLGSLYLKVMSEEIDSKVLDLALNGNISLRVASNTTTVLYKMKLLPGVEFIVDEGAAMTIASTGALYLYDNEIWQSHFAYMPSKVNETVNGKVAFNNEGTAASVVRYSPTRERVKGANREVAFSSALLRVNGTLTANGNVYSTTAYGTSENAMTTTAVSYENVLSGTGTFSNESGYSSSVTLKECQTSTSTLWYVKAEPLLGTVVTGTTVSDHFSDATGITYHGYYHEKNMDGKVDAADYLWSDNAALTTKTVKLVYGGKVLKQWDTTVYPGMDYSGYFSDAACKTAATESSEVLYVTLSGEACIENSAGVKAYDSLNEAMAAAKAGDTVTLLKDVVYSGRGLIVDKTTLDVTLNLNNHSITADEYAILNRGRISIYGGDQKDAAGNDLKPGKLISNGGLTNSSALYTQDKDGDDIFVGDITSIGGNLEMELKGSGRGAIYVAGAYINQFGTAGSKIVVKSPGLLLHVTPGGEISALGGAGSYVEMVQTTGQNPNIRAVYNEGTIGIIGDTDAEVRITQNFEYTGGSNNPELLTSSGTITAIGGTNATVLMNQYAASGIGFALRVDAGTVTKVGGDHVNRVEIVSSHIPVYVASAGTIEEIAANTLFVAKARFTSQAAIWRLGKINHITGGWFNSATNTIDAIFRTGDNKLGGSNVDALNSIDTGYGLSSNTVSVDSIVMEKAYNCYPVLPVSEMNAEARIGNVYYSAAKTAITAAKAGETITLLKDVSYNGSGFYFTTSNIDITLNLNNHSVTATDYALLNRGKISIYGGDLKDAEGNDLPAGKLITTGTNTSLSTCIYNQHYEKVNGEWVEYDAHIYSIGGNLELVDTNGKAHGAIYNWGAHIGEIGTDGSKIVVKGPSSLIRMTQGATLDVLGGAGSTVELVQDKDSTSFSSAIYLSASTIGQIGAEDTENGIAGSTVKISGPYKLLNLESGAKVGVLGGAGSTVELIQTAGTEPSVVYLDGSSITTIGAAGATVKMVQNNTPSDHGKLVYLLNSSKITEIGAADGSKVLIDQTVSGKTGWAIYLRTNCEVTTIGGPNSKVEVIGYGYPLYCNADSEFGTVTGDTLLVTKVRDGNYDDILWTVKPITTLTGGYYCCASSYNEPDRIFNEETQENIETSGYWISDVTVERKSEITGETYNCYYLLKQHEHVYSAEPTIEWATKDGKVILTAVADCQVEGCTEQITGEAKATFTDETVGNVYKAIYTATVTLGDQEYTRTKTDELEYAGTKTMKYDDRITSEDIRILNAGVPNEDSKNVSTGEQDDAVITAYGNKLVATGIGTGAKAVIDGKVYDITVEKAIIDLFMITGHSVGMGSRGTTYESVLIDDGSAYSFTVTNTETGGYRYIDVIPEDTDGIGLGYAAGENRPPEVDNFTAEGGGVIGEDSGLAWKWNKLTGHKVYVVNSAVGSTSMYHWHKDTSNDSNATPIKTNAIANFTRARQIIQNEIDAGHFEMGTMTMINHSSANYSSGAIQMAYDDVNGQIWFEEVLGDITKAMNIDWDNDRTVEASETMSVGFVPIWTRPRNDTATSANIDFSTDKPAVLYMGADAAYEDYYVASLIGLQQWGDDAKVQAYFKNYVQEYTAQNGKTLEVPTTNLELYPDYVHYKQFTYNEMGIDIAKNLYARLYGTTNTVSLKLFKTDGKTEVAADGEEMLALKSGEKLKLVPIADPVTVSDFTFETEGSMAIEYPLTIYGKSGGEGTLTISYKGKVLKTIKIDMGEAVAQIGETVYFGFQQAIDAAAEGDTVTLLRDIDVGSGSVIIPKGKKIHLDLNNHSVTGTNHVLINRGTLLSLDGGDLKDAEGKDLPAGKVVTTGASGISSALFNQNRELNSDGSIKNQYDGHIDLICGNLELKASGPAQGALVNAADASIDQIGNAGSKIIMTAQNIVLHNISGATITALGGANSYVEINHITGQNKYVRGLVNDGTIEIVGDTNAEVRVDQKFEYTGGGNAQLFSNAGTVTSIGGAGATVLMKQTSASGVAFGLYNTGSIVSIGYDAKGIEAKRVEIISARIPVYNSAAATISTIGGNALIVGETLFVGDGGGVFWNDGLIETLSGGYYAISPGTTSNTVANIFQAKSKYTTLDHVAEGMAVSPQTVAVTSLANEKTYPCYAITEPVAKVGESNYYYHIQSAVDAAQKGDVVTLLKDQTLTSALTVAKEQDITIDLGGHTLSRDSDVLINNGTLAIRNGNLSNTDPATKVGEAEGACILNNGTITSISGKMILTAKTIFDGAIQNNGRIDVIGGEGSDITVDSANICIYQPTSGASIGFIGGDGGKLTLKSTQLAISTGKGSSIGTIGGENAVVNMETTGTTMAVKFVGTTVDTIGGTDSQITIKNANSYTMNLSGSTIGIIGGTRAKIKLINDATSGNVVMLNVVSENYNTASPISTIDTIGGTDAEITMLQRGKSTGIQYGILINGNSKNTATSQISEIGEIGAGAKCVEIVVDDCAMYVDGWSKIGEIGDNVYFIARNASTNPNSSSTINGKPANVQSISGGYFSRGNQTAINSVVPAEIRSKALFDTATREIVSLADGNTYTCFYVHDHTYSAPVFTWVGSIATASITCKVCGDGTADKTVALNDVTVTSEVVAVGNCMTPASVKYTASVVVGTETYTDFVTLDGELGDHIPAEAVRENEKAATCYEKGSYDEVVYCSVEACKAEISRTTQETNTTGIHTPGTAVRENEKAATCYKEGSYDEVIRCAEEKCQAELNRTTVTVDKLDHTPAAAVRENENPATCTTAGSYDEVVYCSVEACKAEISRTTKTIDATGHSGAADAEWQHDGANHWQICPDCKEPVNTEAHSYGETGKCECGAEEQVEEDIVMTSYKTAWRSQIGLIEPWFLRINVAIADAEFNQIDYSKLTDYGFYFIRESNLDNAGMPTTEDLVNDADAVCYEKSAVKTQVLSGGRTYFYADYDKGLYTYEMSESIYAVFYFELENGGREYTVVKSFNLKQLLNERKEDTEFGELERAVYAEMSQLEADITAYRVGKTGTPMRMGQKLTADMLGASATDAKYKYAANTQIVIIEPWGIQINAAIVPESGQSVADHVDYATAEDYGMVMYYDVDGNITDPTQLDTVEEMLALTGKAYIFSKENGAARDDVRTNYITARYYNDVYTYQLDTTVYAMFYLKKDGKYYYSNVRPYNVYDLAVDRGNDPEFGDELERNVYQSMVRLYSAITTYRDDYFKKNEQ